MKKILYPLVLSTVLLTACSSSYSQEDVDTMKAEYESQISELQTKVTELESQISELSAVPSVPGGMSDMIYSYGISTLKYVDSYIDGSSTAQECQDNLHSLLNNLILSNRSNLSPTDNECYTIMAACFTAINKIADEDFSEYSIKDLESLLSTGRTKLAECLYVQ